MQSKISVVVPVYNVSSYLKQCLDSILNQTYQYLEIILVNDGSTDESPLICDQYAKKDKRIKVIHQQNQGVSQARNEGMKLGTGEYVTFVDSDDFLHPNMYQRLIEEMEMKNVELVMCDYYRYLNENQVLECLEFEKYGLHNQSDIYKHLILPMVGSDIKRLSCPPLMGSNCRCLYKTKVIEENDLKFKSYKIAEDMLFHLEYLALIESAYVVKESLYFYRYNEQSATLNYKQNLFEILVSQTGAVEKVLVRYNDEEWRERLISRRLYFFCWCLSNEMHSNKDVTYGERRQQIYTYLKSDEGKLVFRWKYLVRMNPKESIIWATLKLNLYPLFYYYHQYKQLM